MVAMKEVLPKVGPFFVAGFRLIPTGLLLIGFAGSRGRPLPSGFNAWFAISIFAIVDATCFQKNYCRMPSSDCGDGESDRKVQSDIIFIFTIPKTLIWPEFGYKGVTDNMNEVGKYTNGDDPHLGMCSNLLIKGAL